MFMHVSRKSVIPLVGINAVKDTVNNKCMQSSKRYLALHEYQIMNLLKPRNLPLPKYCIAKNINDIEVCGNAFNGIECVVKAQILSGGRGLGKFKENNFNGGVHVCKTFQEAKEKGSLMLGNTLVTKQSGSAGKICNTLLFTERFNIKKERYFAILMDRAAGGPLLVGSKCGGTSIEDIAHETPEAIVKMPVDIENGLTDNHCKDFAKKLGFENSLIDQCSSIIKKLYQFFIEKDCTLVEINPLAETHDQRVLICDSKVNFDDNSSYRQADVFSLRDYSQEDKREIEASKYDLNYIGLDGSIGCMVNGAGLAMATMDIINYCGGTPANFLDVGGGAEKNQVVEALRIVQNDPKVKAVFINIFGGIMKCDTIADGIVHAVQELDFSKPLVVRLEGTNSDIARKILDNCPLNIAFNSDFYSAAKQVVNFAKQR